jgi:hypothetical protein
MPVCGSLLEAVSVKKLDFSDVLSHQSALDFSSVIIQPPGTCMHTSWQFLTRLWDSATPFLASDFAVAKNNSQPCFHTDSWLQPSLQGRLPCYYSRCRHCSGMTYCSPVIIAPAIISVLNITFFMVHCAFNCSCTFLVYHPNVLRPLEPQRWKKRSNKYCTAVQ